MLKLMKLEIKKYKLSGNIKAAAIANLIIMAIINSVNYASKFESKPAMENYAMAFLIIDSMVRATFIIFASTLISKIIIDEYKNKTITVLFMYPINRKKIMIAKLIIIIIIFTFVSIVVSNIFLGTSLYLFDSIFNFMSDKPTMGMIAQNSIKIISSAFACSLISLISLYFGMRKKSSRATIVSAIVIVSLICSNSGQFSLYSIIAVPLSLSVIGAFIGYLAIKNIEHLDITN